MDTSFFVAWMEEIATAVQAQRDHLTQLDAAIGDADHGSNLDRGFGEVRRALADSPPETPGSTLMLAGSTLIRKVGGASGPLYGTAFRQMGKSLGDVPDVSLAELSAALDAALAGVQKLGAAVEGDKTMVDALAPAVRALAQAVQEGAKPEDALSAVAAAAQEGARATIPLQARKGRASYLGSRSAGHEDPGAASTALVLSALRTAGFRTW
ncbi:dihydroxyacetone kinase subunit DhaL [Acrocarpospora sp. B8E8]|uniref:dihydroxyacetone kinase subunit DhaL n=1 Tax=Acrocarpospora sp. B8E8 TaxID=3153572 RepID=UPI00325DAEBE